MLGQPVGSVEVALERGLRLGTQAGDPSLRLEPALPGPAPHIRGAPHSPHGVAGEARHLLRVLGGPWLCSRRVRARARAVRRGAPVVVRVGALTLRPGGPPEPEHADWAHVQVCHALEQTAVLPLLQLVKEVRIALGAAREGWEGERGPPKAVSDGLLQRRTHGGSEVRRVPPLPRANSHLAERAQVEAHLRAPVWAAEDDVLALQQLVCDLVAQVSIAALVTAAVLPALPRTPAVRLERLGVCLHARVRQLLGLLPHVHVLAPLLALLAHALVIIAACSGSS
mmetsp:Transcript_8851/g.26124  ORF Transcript_8851/g.26124 Transcript_8851/m.26124 type:complete len:283 (-) Transcript_8851:132-980(-)